MKFEFSGIIKQKEHCNNKMEIKGNISDLKIDQTLQFLYIKMESYFYYQYVPYASYPLTYPIVQNCHEIGTECSTPEPLTELKHNSENIGPYNVLCPLTETDGRKMDQQLYQLIEKKLLKIHRIYSHNKQVKNCWTSKEDEALFEFVQKYGPNWTKISKKFKKRSHIACQRRFSRLQQSHRLKHMFSPENTIKLASLLKQTFFNWPVICQAMPEFEPSEIEQMCRHLFAPQLRRHSFSFNEDIQIVRFVLQGKSNWQALTHEIEGRSEESLRDRYERRLKDIEIEAREELAKFKNQ